MRIFAIVWGLAIAQAARADTSLSQARERVPLVGGVAAQTRGAPLAVWSGKHVFVSVDDGRTFRRVRKGDVVADAHAAYVVDDEGMTAYRSSGETRRSVPGALIAAGGPYLVTWGAVG